MVLQALYQVRFLGSLSNLFRELDDLLLIPEATFLSKEIVDSGINGVCFNYLMEISIFYRGSESSANSVLGKPRIRALSSFRDCFTRARARLGVHRAISAQVILAAISEPHRGGLENKVLILLVISENTS